MGSSSNETKYQEPYIPNQAIFGRLKEIQKQEEKKVLTNL